jgi:intein/homing endonuclease
MEVTCHQFSYLSLNTQLCPDKRSNVVRKTVITSGFKSYIQKLGVSVGVSNTQVIPSVVMSDSEALKSFVRGYMEGDGSVYFQGKQAVIECSSASRKLIQQLLVVFRNYGVIGSTYEKKIRIKNGLGKYYGIRITGSSIQQYSEHFGFISRVKSTLLKNACSIKSYSNNDVIPGIGDTIRDLKMRGQDASRVSGGYYFVSGEVQKLKLKCDGSARSNWTYELLNKWLCECGDSAHLLFPVEYQRLKDLAKLCFYFDRVKSITRIQRKTKVYDLSLP